MKMINFTNIANVRESLTGIGVVGLDGPTVQEETF